MRIRLLVLAAVLLWPAVHAQDAELVLSEILPDPDGGREFVEIWNHGAAIDLHGWAIEDGAGNRFDFGARTLASGARIVVWGGGEATAEGPAWSKSTVWNNGGDSVFLLHGEVVVDRFDYGSAGGPAAPAKGQSLALHDDAWMEGAPTPGTGEAAVVAHVDDVPTRIELHGWPASAVTGQNLSLRLQISDDNGAQDVGAWRVISNGSELFAGSGPVDSTFNATAPDAASWRMEVHVDDPVASSRTFEVSISQPELRVSMPPGGIQFNGLVPGASNVTASAPFQLTNQGPARAPRIDISDFHGPGTLPVAGRVSMGIDGHWTPYTGPLTQLPELAQGATVDVWLRIDEVPIPLPAGAYGTSFAVVP